MRESARADGYSGVDRPETSTCTSTRRPSALVTQRELRQICCGLSWYACARAWPAISAAPSSIASIVTTAPGLRRGTGMGTGSGRRHGPSKIPLTRFRLLDMTGIPPVRHGPMGVSFRSHTGYVHYQELFPARKWLELLDRSGFSRPGGTPLGHPGAP